MKKILAAILIAAFIGLAILYILPMKNLFPRTALVQDNRPPVEHFVKEADFSVKTFAAWDKSSPVKTQDNNKTKEFTVDIYQSNGGKNEYPIKITVKPAPDDLTQFAPGVPFALVPNGILIDQVVPQSERAFKLTGGEILLSSIVTAPAAKFVFLAARKGTTFALYATTVIGGYQYIFLQDIEKSDTFSQEELEVLKNNFKLVLDSFKPIS